MEEGKLPDANFSVEKLPIEERVNEEKEANRIIVLGAGVGILGVASAALVGAVCPLCVVVAPGLIGYGAYRRWGCFSAKKLQKN